MSLASHAWTPRAYGMNHGPQRGPRVHGGIFRILNAVHGRNCTLGKNARLVAIAIAWRMGARQEVILGVRGIMASTRLGRSAASKALAEACGPKGVLTKTRRGRGNCNQYEPRVAHAETEPGLSPPVREVPPLSDLYCAPFLPSIAPEI